MVFFVALVEVDWDAPGPVEPVAVGDWLALLLQAATARMTIRPNARVSVRCRRRIAPLGITPLVCMDTVLLHLVSPVRSVSFDSLGSLLRIRAVVGSRCLLYTSPSPR